LIKSGDLGKSATHAAPALFYRSDIAPNDVNAGAGVNTLKKFRKREL
jgi:hypothetical protein